MTEITARLSAALADRYRIERRLGEGGMATVYLAEDLKHKRQVAVKVLKPELSAVIGGERFVKEIEVTANLQHPNILPLYDSGTATSPDGDGTFLYYVMPFIDGESLRDRIDRERQLPVEESVSIAKSVAAALDYAHRHEVVHRDIKPENILLHDGQALVADFGIALAVSAAGGQRMTETGMSIGTPHYMSPEQASADRELDGRTDVYSLGATLHEMLAGQPPFIGASAQAIVAKILTEEPPPVTKERPSVPGNVEFSIRKCLAKLPADRFQTAAELSEALSSSTYAAPYAGATGQRPATNGRWRVPALIGVSGLLLAAALWGWFRPQPKQSFRLAVAFAEGEQIQRVPTRRFAISPDGERIVYVGQGTGAAPRQLWVRELDQLSSRPIPGTDLPRAVFFSPDGQSIGFVDGEPGDLKVAPIGGGPVRTVASDSANPWGGSWGPNGWLYYSTSTGRLVRVRASGGEIETIATPDSTDTIARVEYDWPEILPNGKGLIFQIWRSSVANASIATLSLESGEVRLLADALYARYLATGHLLYVTFEGSLFAQAFDQDRLEFTGDPVAIESGVRFETFAGVGQFDVSQNGHLVYQGGESGTQDQVVRVDREGVATPVDPEWRGGFETLSLSPDGSMLALGAGASDGGQIWVKELDAGPQRPLTFEGNENHRPTWAPDGSSVTYLVATRVLNTRADGGAPSEEITVDAAVWEVEWSNDGTWLVMRTGGTGTGTRDLQAFRPGIDSVLRVVVASPADEYGPALSPDGRWIAYVSNESGREEVYVRPFPEADRVRVQVSVNGGTEPRWAHSGRELFMRNTRGEMVVYNVRADESTFTVEGTEVLFDASEFLSDNFHHAYDVSLDDQRFVMIKSGEAFGGGLILAINWFEELKDKMGR